MFLPLDGAKRKGRECPDGLNTMDDKIAPLLDLIERMGNGQLIVEPPPLDGDEDIARVSAALCSLGQRLDQRFRDLFKLFEVIERINAGLVLDEVLDFAFDELKDIIPCDRLGFSLIDEEGRVTAYWAKSNAKTMVITKGYSAPLAGSSLEEIVQTGLPRVLNDLEAYAREHPNSRATRDILREGMRSSLTCPLLSKGKAIGFVFFSSTHKNQYAHAHIRSFLAIARHFSLVAEKSLLYEKVVHLNERSNSFLGMAAHDLRGPLVILRSYLELSRDGAFGPPSEQQAQVFERMRGTVERMFGLVNTLLDVSAIKSGKLVLQPRAVELRPLLEENVELNGLIAQRKGIAVKLICPPDLPAVHADPDRLQQILDNLLSNAIKFSRANTHVTVKACEVGSAVEISVRDCGQGIPAEELEQLFVEFSKTSVRPTGGEPSTGLGLAIVARLIEAHGGRIGVESTVGEGSRFWFFLPKA